MSSFVPVPDAWYSLAPFVDLVEQVVYWLLVVGAGHLGYRWVRAYERRGVDTDRAERLQRRVRHLEATVARVEIQVEQSLEAQRFTSALLWNRPGAEGPRLGRQA